MEWREDGKDAWTLHGIPKDSEVDSAECFLDHRGVYHVLLDITEKSSARSLEKALAEAKRRISRLANLEARRIQAREARELRRQKERELTKKMKEITERLCQSK